MKISPLDIRKQTFRTTFRGSDTEEVRVFLDLLATEYENALQEMTQLKDRVHHCEERLVEYRELDQTLRNSLLTAERLASEAKASAQKEAGSIIQDAEWRAKQILEDARERLLRLSEDIRELQSKKESYAQHLRSFLQAQIDLLDNNEQVLEGIDRLAEDARMLAAHTHRTDIPGVGRREGGLPPGPEAPEDVPELIVDADPPMQQAAAELPTASDPEEMIPPTPERGLGRFDDSPEPREAAPAVESDPVPDRELPQKRPESGHERTEGLFEISADEDPPPRPRQ